MIGRAAPLVIALIVTFACTSPSSEVKSAPSPSIVVTGVASPSPVGAGYLGSVGTNGCKPAAAFHTLGGGTSGFPEAGMDTAKGSIWALFFNPVPPPANQEIKVVWRMTGAGDFTFEISDIDGKTVPLVWGPEAHGSSSWNHPGSEVGTGFKFPHPGCWQIHVARSAVDADLWLEVAA